MHLRPGTMQEAMSVSPTDPPELSIRRAVAADAAAVRQLTHSAYAKWIPLIHPRGDARDRGL